MIPTKRLVFPVEADGEVRYGGKAGDVPKK
jgi:hypothetical protein